MSRRKSKKKGQSNSVAERGYTQANEPCFIERYALERNRPYAKLN